MKKLPNVWLASLTEAAKPQSKLRILQKLWCLQIKPAKRPDAKDDAFLVEKAKVKVSLVITKIYTENNTPRYVRRYRGSFHTKKSDF